MGLVSRSCFRTDSDDHRIYQFWNGLCCIYYRVIIRLFACFSVLGFGGAFRSKFKSERKELLCGTIMSILLRYLCHFISGYVVWGEYAEWFLGEVGSWGQNILNTLSGNTLSAFYSFVYNGTYMIPELVITAIVAYLIAPYAKYSE